MSDPVPAARAGVALLSRTRFFRRYVGPVVMPRLDRLFLRLSGGRLQLTTLIAPSLVLHTIGAKSGQPRDVNLIYAADGRGRALVAGTNWAGATHPAWTANLLAHPDVAITVRGRRMSVRASLIPDDERDEAWARLEAVWPKFRTYEDASGRTVRLFRLQPVRRAD
ncbi:nitroreductase family deazaflavin-dependent oxidoreductase [Microbacterium candidum]|uniref:Nitroreductase family deazaflavin-dependent oxidoreductase n=1 Tax=Microbacterium candidum TaxID=3041922 RepID=A0ABT7N3S8_9MICO|nr:nitroreductase family deazaflavin-dependent oxidoreductase [Microbacterium sp. ASV49]MDL9981359.1 nitroreductase family deazaflavin-dependent oxidoreductase [Microbacterium sp. ASV49]